jgi:hypothetical protein
LKQQGATARRIAASFDNELVFLNEIPIRFSWDIKKEVLSDESVWSWWRYEAKVDWRGKECDVRAGQTLVIAEYPYSTSRVHQAIFKRGSHKGAIERVSLSRRCSTQPTRHRNSRLELPRRGHFFGAQSPKMRSYFPSQK